MYLVCEAEGYPTPNVTWKKNNMVLQTRINKTDFIIDDTSEKEAGIYECEASNSVGTVSYIVEVTIKGNKVICQKRGRVLHHGFQTSRNR